MVSEDVGTVRRPDTLNPGCTVVRYDDGDVVSERNDRLVPYDPTAELREWIAEYGAGLTEGYDDARAAFDRLLEAVIAEASRG